MTTRTLKRKILEVLVQDDLETVFKELESYPPSSLLNPLFSGLCNTNEKIKWHAVKSMGKTVARLADADREGARIVMRRFMWSLNDESGGIGWGAPEAMAEAMACHKSLADEYGHILVAYMREDGNFLEYEPLQRGLLWGIGRLAQTRRDLLRKLDAPKYLKPYIELKDPALRGLAAWALGILGAKEASSPLRSLLNDTNSIRFFLGDKIIAKTVGELARDALDAIG